VSHTVCDVFLKHVCDVDTSNRIKKVSYTRNPVKKKNEYEETKRSKNEQCNKRVDKGCMNE
jgi:hypothetical protein